MVYKLEEEVTNILSVSDFGLHPKKNKEIFIKFYSLTGGENTSVKDLASMYGLSTERVRCIVKDILANISFNHQLPLIKNVYAIIKKLSPCTVEVLMEELDRQELVNKSFNVDSLFNLYAIYHQKKKKYKPYGNDNLELLNYKNNRYIINVNHSIVREMDKFINSYTSHHGISYVAQIKKELRNHFNDLSLKQLDDIFRSLLKTQKDIVWLDENHTIFFYSESGRNRLINRIKKIFSVYNEVCIEDIHTGLNRSWGNQKTSVSITPLMLKRFLSKFNNLLLIGDVIKIKKKYNGEKRLTHFEKKVIEFLKKQPQQTCNEIDFERNLLKSPKDKFHLSIVMGYSPILKKQSRGIYTVLCA